MFDSIFLKDKLSYEIKWEIISFLNENYEIFLFYIELDQEMQCDNFFRKKRQYDKERGSVENIE